MSGGPNEMQDKLQGMRVAFLVDSGFEEDEVVKPRRALDAAGAKTELVGPEASRVRSWHRKDWGAEFAVDVALEEARPDRFDALVLPGGVRGSDLLRGNRHALALVRHWMESNGPLAAICHGSWLLVDTESARGRKLTSHPRIANDLKNAGAEWFDADVVVDANLVTSRGPDDLPAFIEKMLDVFARAAQEKTPQRR